VSELGERTGVAGELGERTGVAGDVTVPRMVTS